MNVLVVVLAGVVRLADEVPKDEDVKAGWTAFVIFLLLIGAVAFLGLSLFKHLRRAQAAEDAGLYGSDPKPETADDEGADAEPENHSTS